MSALPVVMVQHSYERKVVGWSMSERMTGTLVCDALCMALLAPQRPKGVIMHADSGIQYYSRQHRQLSDEQTFDYVEVD